MKSFSPARFMRRFFGLVFLALAHPYTATASDNAGLDAQLAQILNFETNHTGTQPSGWRGGPAETLLLDNAVTHGGEWAALIDRRNAGAQPSFSSLTKSIPMDFEGSRIELRGFIRTEDVSEFAGLWMRQDGPDGVLEFENMQRRQLKGTTDWTEYSISLPVNPAGRNLFFGFLLGGSGRAWVDDLQLLVDDQPVWLAPKTKRAETIFDHDHAFDSGSRITAAELTPAQITNLARLGQVWGFLKYHHPKVTAGRLHWDYELFRVLPALLSASDGPGANAVLLQWLDALGELETYSHAALDETSLHLHPELSWLNDQARWGPELSARLRAVHAGRSPDGGQFYVSLARGVGNPVFQNEPAYNSVKLPDTGYQLLALFRFWNIVRYWFPYRDLIDENWDAVLAEFIPRVALAKDAETYQLELIALIAKVHDTHANLWSSPHVRPPVGDSQLPVTLRFIEGRPVVTSPEVDAAVGLQRGDEIMAIDGIPVAELVSKWSPYYPASNEAKRLHDIAQLMMRGSTGPVRLQVRGASGIIEIDATRLPIAARPKTDGGKHDLPGPAFRLLSKDVAYLKLSAVKAADAAGYVTQAAGTKGWIIDIRNYPAEFVVFALGSHFVNRTIDFARFTTADLKNPGAFSFTNMAALRPVQPGHTDDFSLEKSEFEQSVARLPKTHSSTPGSIEWQPPNRSAYAGKLVILVDESSLSQAEYTAMAFRSAPNAIVVGSTTAGADGDVSRIPLPGGLHTMISGIGIFHPDKRPTQRVGIIADVEARPTIEGVRAGRDEVLEEALRQILGADVSADQIKALAMPSE